MKYKILKDGINQINCNSYLIYNEEKLDAYIIDAPTKTKLFIDEIENKNLNLRYVLLTHGHWDHIVEIDFWRQEYGAKIVAHEKTRKYLNDPEYNLSYRHMPEISTDADIYIDGEKGEFDIFKFICTPGHSFDSISIILKNIIFCGDVIFYESVGRADLIGSNPQDLIKSIREVIYKFDDDTRLFPGHGQATTVGHEKINNPFVPFI